MSLLSKIFKGGSQPGGMFQGQLNPSFPSLFKKKTNTLPNGGGQYISPTPAQPNAGLSFSPGQNPGNISFGAPQSLFAGGNSQMPPTAPTAPTAPRAPSLPPEELAYTANAIRAAVLQHGDIPAYAAGASPFDSSGKLFGEMGRLNNARNDLAVGETDPYKWGSESGIPYSPQELAAIEKATAGIYDPALEDAKIRFNNAVEIEKEKAKAAAGVNNNQMTDNERAAQTLFQGNPIVRDYNTVVTQKNTIDRIIGNGVGGPADLASIFTFMKALDPTSVVRESEYDNAAKSGNLFQGVWARFNGYLKDKGGILPENVKQEFQNLINQKLSAQTAVYQNLADQTREIARRQGMNPDNVVIDFTGAVLEPSGGGNSYGMPVYPGFQYNPQTNLYEEVSFNTVGGGTNSASNRPQRNNNPLNIKASTFTSTFPGVAGIDPSPASDGGNFLVFASPEAGLAAAKKLLGSSIYNYLSVDQALRKWSGNGYGGEIVGPLAQKTVAMLSPQELEALIQTMARREGFYA